MMSEEVNGGNKSERKVAAKNEASGFIKKGGICANTVPSPPNINGRKFIELQGKAFCSGGPAIAEQKFWWYPENHEWVRGSFEWGGRVQLITLLSQPRENQQRPEWIEESIWKQLCHIWEAKKQSKAHKNKIQLNNQKTPFAASSTSGPKDKIKQGKFDEPIKSSPSKKDHGIPPEVKKVMDMIMKEQENMMKMIENMNQIWIQHVQSLAQLPHSNHVGPTFQQPRHPIAPAVYRQPPPPPVPANNPPRADFRQPWGPQPSPSHQLGHTNVYTLPTTLPPQMSGGGVWRNDFRGKQPQNMKGNGGYNWKKDYEQVGDEYYDDDEDDEEDDDFCSEEYGTDYTLDGFLV
ncbi:uncharacterized protein G2W53_041783 [Senna tora]|uniref:Uncharacterized protein n=1 Tax=Senna tora TaxID=362788 RepID=A0A834VZ19_9FABA|nr:uncharacterized protein G2W53_041783 [Senna tora]